MIPRRNNLLNQYTLPSTHVSLPLSLPLLPRNHPRPSPRNKHKMTSKNITILDNHYFQFHIVATFAEFLNDVEQHCYETLDDDEWWEECAKEFIPIIRDETHKLEDTQKKLFEKVMSKFPEKFLTEAQTNELLEQVGMAIQAYISQFNPICYCRDPNCDFECGVQSCGSCIDVCRCRWY